jgi:hypothetical protein
MQLSSFLAEHFPALTFPAVTARPGNFPSLRFELGGGLPYDNDEQRDERVDYSAARAVSIFETAFRPEDEGFASFTRWRSEDDPRFLALLPAGCEVTCTEGEDFYKQDEPDTPHVTYTTRVRPRSIDYPTLFNLTASSELRGPRAPSLDGRCYLVNVSTPLIFHMYDDRGAMVVATRDADFDDLRARFGDEVIP